MIPITIIKVDGSCGVYTAMIPANIEDLLRKERDSLDMTALEAERLALKDAPQSV